MDINISISANSKDLFEKMENKDLELYNAEWNKEVSMEINNPYFINSSNILHTELPNKNAPKYSQTSG